MHRHRRHASLDSYSAAAASANLGQSSIRHAYTLQQTPGLRTARLTAHTSPLSLAAALTPPLTPRGPVEFEDKIGLPALAMKSANPLDEEGSDSSESDAELDAEMERMVSSVVNSPTEPDPPMTKSEQRASLGYGPPPGLPPPPPVSGYFAGQMPHLDLNERKERMSSFASAGRSLLGASESSAKTNIGMQAAFGNFKKRCLSISHMPRTPQVIVSPVEDEEDQAKTLLVSTQSANNLVPSADVAGKDRLRPVGHRRSFSVGAMPSLDQIRDWSQRKHCTHSAETLHEVPEADQAQTFHISLPVVSSAESHETKQTSTQTGNRLDRILRERSSSSAGATELRLKPSGVKASGMPTHTRMQSLPMALRMEKDHSRSQSCASFSSITSSSVSSGGAAIRSECARRMFEKLEKRRSTHSECSVTSIMV